MPWTEACYYHLVDSLVTLKPILNLGFQIEENANTAIVTDSNQSINVKGEITAFEHLNTLTSTSVQTNITIRYAWRQRHGEL